jgi:hypothetical protein
MDHSLALNPSFAEGWYDSGVLRNFAGQPDLAISHLETSRRIAQRRPGTESSLTLSWRGVDSNFQYAEAIKLVVAPFSCADCLGRVGAPIGVLRFSSFSSTSTA